MEWGKFPNIPVFLWERPAKQYSLNKKEMWPKRDKPREGKGRERS